MSGHGLVYLPKNAPFLGRGVRASVQYMASSSFLDPHDSTSQTASRYFNVRSKADLSQFNLPPVLHRNDFKNRADFEHALCYNEIRASPTTRVLPSLELCPKLRTWKISPRQVDIVVSNKTRRWWSLLTTPTTADASWLFTTRRSTVTSICCGFVVQVDKRIEMPFGMWSLAGPRNLKEPCIGRRKRNGAIFGRYTRPCPDMPGGRYTHCCSQGVARGDAALCSNY